MLIRCYQSILEKIDKDIVAAYGEILSGHKLFLDRDLELRQYLEPFNQNLINTKENTFLKDKLFFVERRTYRWNTTLLHRCLLVGPLRT